MFVEALITLIVAIVLARLILSNVSRSFLRHKLPMVITYYRDQKIRQVLSAIMSSLKNRSKIESYFPAGVPDDNKHFERLEVLEWYVTQSNAILTVHTPENVYQTWNISKKYKEQEEDFYNQFGFYPTINEENATEDLNVILEWNSQVQEGETYHMNIEWSVLVVFTWLIQVGIIDYFDDNFEKIETMFQQLIEIVELVDESSVEEDDVEETINNELS